MDRPRTRSMSSKQYDDLEPSLGSNTIPPSTPHPSQQIDETNSNSTQPLGTTAPRLIRFPEKLNTIAKRNFHNTQMPPPPLAHSAPAAFEIQSGSRAEETPIKMPAGDFGVPGRETHDAIDSVLVRQLKHAHAKGLVGLDRLKFPDECFPFDIRKCTEQILQPKGNKKKLYRNNIWVNYPVASTPHNARESKVCDIFNSIGESIMRVGGLGSKLVRKWTSRFSSSPIPHDKCTRQPDITLMNTAYMDAPKDQISWRLALGDTELKIGATVKEEDNKMQLAQTARLTFGAQPDRRFVLGLSLINSKLTLYVFNRGCLMTSDTFDIHQQPERLIRIVAGFMFANREYLGFDKKMEITEVDGQCSGTVTINANTCVIEEVLHVEDVLRGRATVCLRVTRDGQTCVVKNAWVDASREVKEPQILQKLEGVENVTQLVEYECVKLDTETVDSTIVDIERLTRLGQLTEDQKKQARRLDNRQQVRVVLSPFGRPLRRFRSIRELFKVFLNTVEERLYERNILHRDISLRNILITDEGENREGQGLLIDFDYAIWLLLNTSPATLHRTGTVPFMAIDVLERSKVHRYDHDLESIFYVMCYLFCTSAGPDGLLRDDFSVRDSVFGEWFGTEERAMERIASTKRGVLLVGEVFDKRILLHLPQYFDTSVVKTCLRQLRRLMFGNSETRQNHETLHKDVDAKIYQTDREDRDPKEFFNAFKVILRTAYENSPKETVGQLISSTSAGYISALAQAEAQLPWRPIDKFGSQQYDGSLDKPSSQMSNPFVTGPGDSGIAMDMGSNHRKRKAVSIDEEAESVSVRRPRDGTLTGNSTHRQSDSGEGAEAMDKEMESAAVEDGHLETPNEDEPGRARKRTKVYPSDPKAEGLSSFVPFPVQGKGEGMERTSMKRVTRSSAKAMAAGIIGSKVPVRTLRRSTRGRESGTSHKYPTRSKTRSQGMRTASIVQPKQQVIEGVRVRTRSQVVKETGLFKARSTPDLRK